MKCTVPGCKSSRPIIAPDNQVCADCDAAGWTANFTEMSELIANDPLLAGKVQIASPLQPPDAPTS